MKKTFPLASSFALAAMMALTACGGGESAAEEAAVEEPEPLADPCPDRVQDMRGSEESFTCSCSPEAAEAGTVWGAGPYSDDSAVCRAAMHAGLVGDEPGNVTITFLPGRESYAASTANDVETRRWGSWGGSFFFEGAEPGEVEEVAEVEACPSNARDLRGTGETVTCACDSNATASGSVWGTDTYTDDSRICRAAVHAGVIDMQGGNVTFTAVGGLDSYSGSTANGVETRDYGRWSGSFEFVTEDEG